MAITTAIASSFKLELMQGIHLFEGTDTYKMALYTNSAVLGASTTAYTATGEVTGDGYTAGGETLTLTNAVLSGTTSFIDFDDPVWASSTITARGFLIYNSSKSNKAVYAFTFGADRSSDNGPFTVQMPVADATNAIIRLTD